MNIAIIGYGEQGRSAYDFFKNKNQITICDQNINLKLPENVSSQLGKNYLSGLDKFDLLIRSPIIHPNQIINNNSPEIINKISSNTNEFLKTCPTKNIIAVTGTKGKGTTSTLITKLLKEDNKKVYLGGNIGTPPLDLLRNNIKNNDWVVLELANFQTIDIKYPVHIAVCLMVVSEHLNWHTNLQEYLDSKKQLFDQQRDDDITIYYSLNNNSKYIVSTSKAHKIPYYKSPGAYIKDNNVIIDNQTICSTKSIKLIGKHNLQNICAAVTTFWQISKNIETIRKVITTFKGLEHRLELVKEINGVQYINDSFGTTPETSIVALESFNQPKIIILGGSDKGADYSKLARTITTTNVKKVVLIGQQAAKIKENLQKVNFTNYIYGGSSMPEIIKNANKLSLPGDIVLLSTACASFDMFENYIDRGNQFKKAVLSLA